MFSLGTLAKQPFYFCSTLNWTWLALPLRLASMAHVGLVAMLGYAARRGKKFALPAEHNTHKVCLMVRLFKTAHLFFLSLSCVGIMVQLNLAMQLVWLAIATRQEVLVVKRLVWFLPFFAGMVISRLDFRHIALAITTSDWWWYLRHNGCRAFTIKSL